MDSIIDLSNLLVDLPPTHPTIPKVNTPTRTRQKSTSEDVIAEFPVTPRSSLKVHRKKKTLYSVEETGSQLQQHLTSSRSNRSLSTPIQQTPLSKRRHKVNPSLAQACDNSLVSGSCTSSVQSMDASSVAAGDSPISKKTPRRRHIPILQPSDDQEQLFISEPSEQKSEGFSAPDAGQEPIPLVDLSRAALKPHISPRSQKSPVFESFGTTPSTAIEVSDDSETDHDVDVGPCCQENGMQSAESLVHANSVAGPYSIIEHINSHSAREPIEVPSSPDDDSSVDEWADASGVLGFESPKKKRSPLVPPTSTPSSPLSNSTLGSSPLISLGGLVYSPYSMTPKEFDDARSLKSEYVTKPASKEKERASSNTNDNDVIVISSSDESEGEPIPERKSTPPIKQSAKGHSPSLPSATPNKPKAKARTLSKQTSSASTNTSTPASPRAGKRVTKASRALSLEKFATALFNELNDEVFGNVLTGCELVWSKLLSTTAGKAFLKKERNGMGAVRTRPDGSVIYALKIELSIKVVDCEERILNTLSHEMCHLATWLVDGVGQPDHGSAWKAWTNKVQAYRPDIEISTRHTYEIAYKYSWVCTNTVCGHVYGRFSKSIDITKQGCGLCRSPLTPLFEEPKKKTAYQEFLKENIKMIRESNPGMSQGEAFKAVAEKWKAQKEQNQDDVQALIDGLGSLAF